MSPTYERPSALCLDGLHAPLLTCDDSGYSGEEICLRTGVGRDALTDLEQWRPAAARYAAIDVVRLAVVDRLVRSGVPVARAAALVRAAGSRSGAAI